MTPVGEVAKCASLTGGSVARVHSEAPFTLHSWALTCVSVFMQNQSPLGSSYVQLALSPDEYPAVMGLPQDVVHRAIAQLQVTRPHRLLYAFTRPSGT